MEERANPQRIADFINQTPLMHLIQYLTIAMVTLLCTAPVFIFAAHPDLPAHIKWPAFACSAAIAIAATLGILTSAAAIIAKPFIRPPKAE